MAAERSVFETRTRKTFQELDVLAQQETKLTETLAFAARELELTRRLYQQKVVPEIELLRIERQTSELRGQLAEVQSRARHHQDRLSRPGGRRPRQVARRSRRARREHQVRPGQGPTR